MLYLRCQANLIGGIKMCNFSSGLIIGAMMGAGLILAVNPMSKRDMKKAYRRAGRMVNKMNNQIRDWT